MASSRQPQQRYASALTLILALLALPLTLVSSIAAATCPDPRTALGVSRVIEIDSSSGAIYGAMTRRTREPSFLAPMEVVLTFDDGPVPRITTPILDTLDKYCTKATFFAVGEKAVDYPAVVQDVIARGHTLATHTFTHPLNLRRLPVERAVDEIERGIAAIALAADAPVAPFFRFPGLSDSDPLLAHLQTRGIASFTVDVVSNDSYIGNAKTLTERVLRLTDANKGGILLFHDIKRVAAKALPAILSGLKARGYKVVHLRAKTPVSPLPEITREMQPFLAKASPRYRKLLGMPSSPPIVTADGAEPPVTSLVSEPRSRLAPAPEPATTDRADPKNESNLRPTHPDLGG